MKLRTKILLSTALLITFLTAASLFIVRSTVNRHVREQIVSSFQNSAVSLKDLQSRKDFACSHASELLVQTPILKAVMTTHDAPTIQDVSSDLFKTSGADLFAVIDGTGTVLASGNTGKLLEYSVVQSTLPRLPADAFTWSLLNGRLFHVVVKKIEAGSSTETNTLGYLALGYEVNSKYVGEMARTVDVQLAFIYKNHSVASTLDVQHADALQATLERNNRAGTNEVSLAGEHFLANIIPLDSGDVRLFELRSYDEATAFVRELNQLIGLVAFGVIVLSAGFVFLISHTITKPLHELVLGVRALSSGDFGYPLKTGGKGEVAELTSSFDRMRGSLQENQQRMVASARMEAVGQLAGGVAHDFNNLITVIKGYADLLSSQVDPHGPLMRCAEQISKAGDRAASLTRQLLTFSRKQVLMPQAVDMNLIVTGLQKMLKVLVGERFEVVLSTSKQLPRVMADPGQIEQVILNLVVNARDAMPEGGKIVVSTENEELTDLAVANGLEPGRFVRLAVTDTGCGMDEETQRQIFQPFFTTKEVGKGTGLGLAIVYGVVKQSGGFVVVNSKIGDGSTFNIFLPGLMVEAQEAKTAEKPAPLVGSETILVVEDEEGVRNMVRDSLKAKGYKVFEAHDGEEAIQFLRSSKEKIDLILSDVVMAKLGGLELAHRVQSMGVPSKILLMSGYTERINEIEEAKLPLLRKPFGPDALAKAIRDTLTGVRPHFSATMELSSVSS